MRTTGRLKLWARAVDSRVRDWARWMSSGKMLPKSLHVAAVGMPAIIMIAISLVFVLPNFIKEEKAVRENHLRFPVRDNLWLVAYNDVSSFAELKALNEHRYEKRHHANYLSQRENEWYWLGLEISPEQQAELARSKATWMVAGQFFGSTEIYINDTLTQTGSLEDVRTPLILDLTSHLTPANLALAKPLTIAIHIRHEMGEPFPDMLHETAFAAKSEIDLYRRGNHLHRSTWVSTAFGAALALGLFFFALWIGGVRKQEMAAFASFSLLHAVIQAGYIDVVWVSMGAIQWHRLNFVTSTYEMVMTIWLGLSLARIRSRGAMALLMGMFIAPWSIFATSLQAGEIYQLVLRIWTFGSPAAYALSAAITFMQARLVSSEHRRDLVDSQRVMKLYASCVILIAMAFAQYYATTVQADIRLVNVVLLAGLAAIVVHEYRRQELFLRRAPLSKYHQRANLPERIRCVLATIDLKKSESLYRFGAEHGAGGRFVNEIMSKFYLALVESGAEVIQTEGDALTFFFDCDTTSNVVDRTVKAITQLDTILQVHLDEKSSTLRGYPNEIRLRAALDLGAIRPTWQRFEGRDVPGWEQAGGSHVFVDVARLMEAEAKTMDSNLSTIVLKPEFAEESNTPVLQMREVDIKHGRKMKISVLALSHHQTNAA